MKITVINGVGVANFDGFTMVNPNLTKEQIKELSESPSKERVIEIFNPKYEEVVSVNKELQEKIELFSDSEYLDYKNGSFFRKGIPYTLPELLIEKYQQFEKEGLSVEALDNFWVKCALNPNPEVRQNLFWFLNKYGFTITPSGNFVVYRSVNIYKDGFKLDADLREFVRSQYGKIRGQKKAPKNYFVSQEEDTDKYLLTQHQYTVNPDFGNLQELWDSLSNETETIYTDDRTGKFRIRIGEPVKMDRQDCDHDQQETCSNGLHVAGADWLSRGSFGHIDIVALVNPCNVVAVPPKDNYGKMRVCEYLPIALAERNEDGNIIPVDATVFETLYDKDTLSNLNKELNEIDPDNQIVYSFKLQDLPFNTFTTIDEYSNILNNKQTKRIWDLEEE